MRCMLLPTKLGGTSYRSRLEEKFMFAGKTGSSQSKKFTEEQREALG